MSKSALKSVVKSVNFMSRQLLSELKTSTDGDDSKMHRFY